MSTLKSKISFNIISLILIILIGVSIILDNNNNSLDYIGLALVGIGSILVTFDTIRCLKHKTKS